MRIWINWNGDINHPQKLAKEGIRIDMDRFIYIYTHSHIWTNHQAYMDINQCDTRVDTTIFATISIEAWRLQRQRGAPTVWDAEGSDISVRDCTRQNLPSYQLGISGATECVLTSISTNHERYHDSCFKTASKLLSSWWWWQISCKPTMPNHCGNHNLSVRWYKLVKLRFIDVCI